MLVVMGSWVRIIGIIWLVLWTVLILSAIIRYFAESVSSFITSLPTAPLSRSPSEIKFSHGTITFKCERCGHLWSWKY
jgi:hypothetical protein